MTDGISHSDPGDRVAESSDRPPLSVPEANERVDRLEGLLPSDRDRPAQRRAELSQTSPKDLLREVTRGDRQAAKKHLPIDYGRVSAEAQQLAGVALGKAASGDHAGAAALLEVAHAKSRAVPHRQRDTVVYALELGREQRKAGRATDAIATLDEAQGQAYGDYRAATAIESAKSHLVAGNFDTAQEKASAALGMLSRLPRTNRFQAIEAHWVAAQALVAAGAQGTEAVGNAREHTTRARLLADGLVEAGRLEASDRDQVRAVLQAEIDALDPDGSKEVPPNRV